MSKFNTAISSLSITGDVDPSKNSKKLFYLFPFVLMLFLGCNKDQKMTNRADGEWEIEQITYTRNGQDSVVMAPIGIFYFEKCELGTGNCSGYYDLEGQDRVTIGYNVDADLNEFNINVISETAVDFGGNYDIDRFDKENLSLSGTASIRRANGANVYDVTLDLKKK